MLIVFKFSNRTIMRLFRFEYLRFSINFIERFVYSTLLLTSKSRIGWQA